MVKFITKEKNRSREQAVQDLFQTVTGAAGFYSRKVEAAGERLGYDLIDLRSGASVPLAREFDKLPADWHEALSHGDFSFSDQGFTFAEQIVDEALDSKVTALFLDEIGKLEIEGGGFASLLERCRKAGVDLYLGCRKINIDPLRAKFGL